MLETVLTDESAKRFLGNLGFKKLDGELKVSKPVLWVVDYELEKIYERFSGFGKKYGWPSVVLIEPSGMIETSGEQREKFGEDAVLFYSNKTLEFYAINSDISISHIRTGEPKTERKDGRRAGYLVRPGNLFLEQDVSYIDFFARLPSLSKKLSIPR